MMGGDRVKVFKIDGQLIVPDDLTHNDILGLIAELYRDRDIFFKGTTKDITDEE